MCILEAVSPTARELFKVEPHWFVIKSPARSFSLLANAHRRPKLPDGHEYRGPFKTRTDAAVMALRWELQIREAA